MKHNESMLDPSMGELKAHINNRYLLVNVTAQLARKISQKAEDEEITLDNKPVTIALHEIADGDVVLVKNQNVDSQAGEETQPDIFEEANAGESVVQEQDIAIDQEQS